MNQLQRATRNIFSSPLSSAANARVGEHWLIPVRIVIVIVSALALTVFFVGVLLNFAQFRSVCTPLSCADGQLTQESAQALQALGLSLDAYAIMNVFYLVIQALVFYLLAAVIFWQRPDEWLTVIVVLFFLAAPSNSLFQPVTTVPPVFLRSARGCAISRHCHVYPDRLPLPEWPFRPPLDVSTRRWLTLDHRAPDVLT